MARNDEKVALTDREISAAFSQPQWADRFPPMLDVDQAADLLRVPKATIYSWSSRGLFRGCGRKVGKRLLFFRDRLIKRVFHEGFDDAK